MVIAKVTFTRRNRLARADSICLFFFLPCNELAHAFFATMNGQSYWCFWWLADVRAEDRKRLPVEMFRKKPVLGRTQKDLIINLQHTRNKKPRRKSWRGRKKLLIFLVALVLATLDLAGVWLLCIEFSKFTNSALPPDSRFGFERGRLHWLTWLLWQHDVVKQSFLKRVCLCVFVCEELRACGRGYNQCFVRSHFISFLKYGRETKTYKKSLVAKVETKCDNMYVEEKLRGQDHLPPNFPQPLSPYDFTLLFFLLPKVPASKAK